MSPHRLGRLELSLSSVFRREVGGSRSIFPSCLPGEEGSGKGQVRGATSKLLRNDSFSDRESSGNGAGSLHEVNPSSAVARSWKAGSKAVEYELDG